jgi:AraC family transcriptional regulator, regulatory protein of adaptative response / methylphosphotriester-DNA alkyltransferase methyltransferase
VRRQTIEGRRRLYLRSRAVVARYYRLPLTVPGVARALASSPRELQRAYAQFGETSFREDLLARRMSAAAELLGGQPYLRVAEVAYLVGYRQPAHFARAFKRRYGVAPSRFRASVDASAGVLATKGRDRQGAGEGGQSLTGTSEHARLMSCARARARCATASSASPSSSGSSSGCCSPSPA